MESLEPPFSHDKVSSGMRFSLHNLIQETDSQRRKILHASLRSRAIHPSLHYKSAEQARKWLVLHRQHAPIATRNEMFQVYENAFAAIPLWNSNASVPIISLGCGGGNKDVRLLATLRENGVLPIYIPCDISAELVNEAASQAHRRFPGTVCYPVVSDLRHTTELRAWLDTLPISSDSRIFLFFGMLPNFSPIQARFSLRRLLRTNDILIISANLTPGIDLMEGLTHVLPQYDNPETRDWLSLFLDDLRIPRQTYSLDFEIQPSPGLSGLYRIAAVVRFIQTVPFAVSNQSYLFSKGESLLLFFSNRYTPRLARQWMKSLGIIKISEWIDLHGEEGVFVGKVGS